MCFENQQKTEGGNELKYGSKGARKCRADGIGNDTYILLQAVEHITRMVFLFACPPALHRFNKETPTKGIFKFYRVVYRDPRVDHTKQQLHDHTAYHQ